MSPIRRYLPAQVQLSLPLRASAALLYSSLSAVRVLSLLLSPDIARPVASRVQRRQCLNGLPRRSLGQQAGRGSQRSPRRHFVRLVNVSVSPSWQAERTGSTQLNIAALSSFIT